MSLLEQPNPNTLRPLSGGFPLWRMAAIGGVFFIGINVSSSLLLGNIGLVASIALTYLVYRVTAVVVRRFPANAWQHYMGNIRMGQRYVPFREEEVLPVVWDVEEGPQPDKP